MLTHVDQASVSLLRWLRRQLRQPTPLREHLEAAVANDDPALRSPWTAGPGVELVDMVGGELRAVLERLVRDPDGMRRAGAQASAHVRESFSWAAHLDRLEAVYLRALDSRIARGSRGARF